MHTYIHAHTHTNSSGYTSSWESAVVMYQWYVLYQWRPIEIYVCWETLQNALCTELGSFHIFGLEYFVSFSLLCKNLWKAVLVPVEGGMGDWSYVVGNWAFFWDQNVWAQCVCQKGGCRYGAGSLQEVEAAVRQVLLKNILRTRSC